MSNKILPTAAILYQDQSLLILDKPSGLPSAPLPSASQLGKATQDTAVSLALLLCPELRLMPGLEHGLLHRLDTGTSGCLAFAKTETAFEFYKERWNGGQVKKIYQALNGAASTAGDAHLSALLKPEQLMRLLPYTVEWPMGHSAKSKKKMIALTPERAQKRHWIAQIRGEARPTLSRILSVKMEGPNPEVPTAKSSNEQLLDSQLSSLLRFEIQIETGVLHQIRCTLATLGYPILGDDLYGGQKHPRLCLHAMTLCLPKQDGTVLEVFSPVPF